MPIPPPYDAGAPSPAAAALWLAKLKELNPTHLDVIDDPPDPPPVSGLFVDLEASAGP